MSLNVLGGISINKLRLGNSMLAWGKLTCFESQIKRATSKMGVEGSRFRVFFAGVPRSPLKGVIGICRVEL